MRTKETLVALACYSMVFAGGLATLAAQSAPSQEPQKPAGQPRHKTAPAVPRRIRVGGRVMDAKLMHKVNPKYPKDARKNHITGTVRMRILVDRDGEVIETNVDSGDPALAKAATEAVRQWRYRPTLVNGEPVQVVTEIEVNFILGRH